MKVVPLNDKIVVKRLEAEDKTAGGIVLPDTAKEKPKQGKVLSLGEGNDVAILTSVQTQGNANLSLGAGNESGGGSGSPGGESTFA